LFNVQRSIVICGGAFGAAPVREQLQEKPSNSFLLVPREAPPQMTIER
jgi:hypothetical protein